MVNWNLEWKPFPSSCVIWQSLNGSHWMALIKVYGVTMWKRVCIFTVRLLDCLSGRTAHLARFWTYWESNLVYLHQGGESFSSAACLPTGCAYLPGKTGIKQKTLLPGEWSTFSFCCYFLEGVQFAGRVSSEKQWQGSNCMCCSLWNYLPGSELSTFFNMALKNNCQTFL